MKFLSIFVLAALAAYVDGNEEEETGARLLISKQILNRYLVEDMDIVAGIFRCHIVSEKLSSGCFCRIEIFTYHRPFMLQAKEYGASHDNIVFSTHIIPTYLINLFDYNTQHSLQYTLYNVGTSTALGVKLSDSSFHKEAFTLVGGQLNIKIDRIPAGTNVSHVVVVRPRKYGYFNFTAAEVNYRPTEDASEVSYHLHGPWSKFIEMFVISIVLVLNYIFRMYRKPL